MPRCWRDCPGWCARTRLPDPGAGRDGTDRPARAAAGELRESLLRPGRDRGLRDLPDGAHGHLGSLGKGAAGRLDLHLVTPVQALKTTWWAAFRHPFSAADAFEFQLELAAMAAMVLAALAFLWWHRWPEAVYCGLPALALGTQTWYQAWPAYAPGTVPGLDRARRA